MCLVGSELDYRTNQVETKRMFHHLLARIRQKTKKKLIDVILYSLKENGPMNNWRRPWMQWKMGQYF